MNEPDIYDCAEVLFNFGDVIARAHAGALQPGEYKRADADRILTLLGLGMVLKEDWTLCPNFERVLADELGKSPAGTPTIKIFQKVASRHSEWLPDGMTGPWRSAAYNGRSRRAQP